MSVVRNAGDIRQKPPQVPQKCQIFRGFFCRQKSNRCQNISITSGYGEICQTLRMVDVNKSNQRKINVLINITLNEDRIYQSVKLDKDKKIYFFLFTLL